MRSTTDQLFRVFSEPSGHMSHLYSIRYIDDVLHSIVVSMYILFLFRGGFVRCHVAFDVHIKRKGWAL